MRSLHRERQVPVVLFQDDDFLAGGLRAREWAGRIANGLIHAGMAGQLVFKISCRSDEIREECLRQLIAGGLTPCTWGLRVVTRKHCST